MIISHSLNHPLISIPFDKQVQTSEYLPQDVVKNIFIHLKSLNLFCDVGISHYWYIQNVEMTKNSIHASIKTFLDGLVYQLDKPLKHPYSTQIKNELLLNALNKVLASKNFLQIQASLFLCREITLNGLKNLEEREVNNLKISFKYMNKPLFFDEIFELVGIDKDIDTLLEEEQGKNLLRFSWIIESLREKWTVNKINKLLNVMLFVSNELKLHGFKMMAPLLKTQELRDKGVLIASAIEDLNERKEAIKLIVQIENGGGKK